MVREEDRNAERHVGRNRERKTGVRWRNEEKGRKREREMDRFECQRCRESEGDQKKTKSSASKQEKRTPCHFPSFDHFSCCVRLSFFLFFLYVKLALFRIHSQHSSYPPQPGRTWDDAVKDAALEAKAFVVCAELAEILCCFRDNIGTQLHHNAAGRLVANVHVHVHFRVLSSRALPCRRLLKQSETNRRYDV